MLIGHYEELMKPLSLPGERGFFCLRLMLKYNIRNDYVRQIIYF